MIEKEEKNQELLFLFFFLKTRLVFLRYSYISFQYYYFHPTYEKNLQIFVVVISIIMN